MNLNMWLTLLMCLNLSSAIQSRSQRKTLKKIPGRISIIIPCTYKHAQYLYALLESYEQQTVLPHEIVISISEVHKIDPSVLQKIRKKHWIFPVKIITSDKVQYAGENRNIACSHATGDIFILQDADDIPHPQRVAIIKHLFKHHKVDHIMHQFFKLPSESSVHFEKLENFANIPLEYPTDFQTVWNDGSFTNGNVAITRAVFNKIKWSQVPRGQDSTFNKEVYAHFKHLLLIKLPLLCYRIFLSSAQTQ